jgi:hypothetical protein
MSQKENIPRSLKDKAYYSSSLACENIEGVKFSSLELRRTYIFDKKDGRKVILRRLENSVLECLLDKKGDMDQLVKYTCQTRNGQGEIGYLNTEVLFDKQDYREAIGIFDMFKEDMENAQKFSLN